MYHPEAGNARPGILKRSIAFANQNENSVNGRLMFSESQDCN